MDVFVKLDNGTMHALADCKWVRFDPHDCACSSSYGDAATTPEAAHKQFVPRQRDRDRETRAGWTVRLLSSQEWSEQARPCFCGKCAHHRPEDVA